MKKIKINNNNNNRIKFKKGWKESIVKHVKIWYGTKLKAPEAAKRVYLLIWNQVNYKSYTCKKSAHLSKADIRVHINICAISSKNRIFSNLHHQKSREFEKMLQVPNLLSLCTTTLKASFPLEQVHLLS